MSNRVFAGRLFGPGLPGAGSPATGRWGPDGKLHVCPEGPAAAEMVVEAPAISAGGFNAAGLRISWQSVDGLCAFVIETDADLAVCSASSPPGIAGRLAAAAGHRTRLERRFRLGGLVLVLVLALPLAGLALFLLNSDRIADWAVARISTEQEARLGDLVLAQSRLQMKIIDRGPAVDAVSAIGGKLTAGSVHNYRWLVADKPDVNAFAAPGGVVVVFSGLIRSAGSAEEIAGVLAHEVAHAELRHSLRAMVKSLGLRALVSLLTGDASGSAFADAATRLMELRYSREAELEADADGLRRLVSARIDPHGMIRFYEKLAGEKRPSPPPILSTHPASGERLERLRKEVTSLKKNWVPLKVDFEAARNSVR